MYIKILIAGFGGGFIRCLMGFIKHQYSYKDAGFKIPYFLAMISISGVVGLLVAAAVKELGIGFLGSSFTPAMALIVGYAGGDFFENLLKIILKQPSLYSFPKR